MESAPAVAAQVSLRKRHRTDSESHHHNRNAGDGGDSNIEKVNDDVDVDISSDVNVTIPNDKDDDEKEEEERQRQSQLLLLMELQEFQHAFSSSSLSSSSSSIRRHKRYHLRISASNVAAICGHHPYKNLPELFLFQHVYQGRTGRFLLQQDLELLHLSDCVTSPEQQLMDLAHKVGTTDAMTVVQTAIQMQQGTIPVSTMATVTALQNDPAILVTAHDTLTPSEYNMLCRGIRDHVNTACGRQWEDAALDQYEQAVGYPVTQRNCELLTWSFVAATAVPSATSTTNDDDGANGNDVATVVVPLRRPSRRTSPYAAPTPSSTTTTSTSVTNEKEEPPEPPDQENKEDIVPYFSIVGSVDGVREEMAPAAPKQDVPSTKSDDQNIDNDSNDTDDEEWEMRHIIVECKHRMRRLCPVPPLYELIQTAIYCLMYEYQYADIVQVLRSSTKKSTTTTTLSATHIEEDNNIRTTDHHDTYSINHSTTTSCSTDGATTTPNGNLPNTERVDPVPLSVSETNDTTHGLSDDDHVAISVYRLNVDDPILQHRANFYTTILPRLQRFTQVVYDWRHDDSQRYALLYAVLVGRTNGGSSRNDDDHDNTISAWKMIQEKCPWLPDDCIGMDTSRTRTV